MLHIVWLLIACYGSNYKEYVTLWPFIIYVQVYSAPSAGAAVCSSLCPLPETTSSWYAHHGAAYHHHAAAVYGLQAPQRSCDQRWAIPHTNSLSPGVALSSLPHLQPVHHLEYYDIRALTAPSLTQRSTQHTNVAATDVRTQSRAGSWCFSNRRGKAQTRVVDIRYYRLSARELYAADIRSYTTVSV